jgi:ceramide glucosyltransferase
VAFVASRRKIGLNPKVNNLANMLTAARHEVLLISDSNVRVRATCLREMVARLLQPGVGLVTSQIRATGGTGLGGRLEALQLNTFVTGGIAAATLLLRRVGAVGKSMLLRRCDLERIGGFEELGRYLAEDQVCGEKLKEAGLRVMVCPEPVDNVLGEIDLRGFAGRHLRWAKIRRHIAPAGYAAEILTNPMVPSLLYVGLYPGLRAVSLVALTLTVLSLTALASERRLSIRRFPLVYPALELLRGTLLAVLWVVPFLSRTVAWRGHRYRIGRRTLLEPLADRFPDWALTDDLGSENVLP